MDDGPDTLMAGLECSSFCCEEDAIPDTLGGRAYGLKGASEAGDGGG